MKRAGGLSSKNEPAPAPSSPATLLGLFEKMVLLRRFEMAAQIAYRKGEMPGFLHLYIGEEATAVGVMRPSPAERLDHQHAPRPRPCAGQGRAAEGAAGRTGRQGRPAAAADAAARMHLYDRASACSAPTGSSAAGIRARRRPGHQRQDPRHRPGGRRLLRRRGDQSRRVPRVAQFRRHPEGAGRVRLREQSLRHGHAACRWPRATPTSPARRPPTAFPASRSTATTCWPSTRRARGGRARPRAARGRR